MESKKVPLVPGDGRSHACGTPNGMEKPLDRAATMTHAGMVCTRGAAGYQQSKASI